MNQEIINPKYTRVSSILSQWDSYGHIDADVLSRKCQIGTNVHQVIENHCNDIFCCINPEEEGYFNSFLAWKKFACPAIVETEKRYYCDEHLITGCVDAVIKFKTSEKHLIVDYKTCVQPNKLTWPLQAHFYHYLASINCPDIKLDDRVLFVQLSKDGKSPKVHSFDITKSTWEVCKAAMITYNWKKKFE